MPVMEAREMIYLKKHRYPNGDEYITIQDFLEGRNENDPKVQKHLEFLCLVEEELNYYNQRTSTAFGDNIIRIKSGKRTRYIIERPCLSAMERENRLEIAALLDKAF